MQTLTAEANFIILLRLVSDTLRESSVSFSLNSLILTNTLAASHVLNVVYVLYGKCWIVFVGALNCTSIFEMDVSLFEVAAVVR